MYEGRYQLFFYAGITKFLGYGTLIFISLIFSLINYYGTINYQGYMAYSATTVSLRFLFDIAFFILLAIYFYNIHSNDSKITESNEITIAALVLSVCLFIDIILIILLYTMGGIQVIEYITGVFFILTSFPAIYVSLKLYRYFDTKTESKIFKILNISFIILGFALFLQYLFDGIASLIPTSVGLAFQSLSNTASSVAYIVFVLVAISLIIYSKDDKINSRVKEASL